MYILSCYSITRQGQTDIKSKKQIAYTYHHKCEKDFKGGNPGDRTRRVMTEKSCLIVTLEYADTCTISSTHGKLIVVESVSTYY